MLWGSIALVCYVYTLSQSTTFACEWACKGLF